MTNLLLNRRIRWPIVGFKVPYRVRFHWFLCILLELRVNMRHAGIHNVNNEVQNIEMF